MLVRKQIDMMLQTSLRVISSNLLLACISCWHNGWLWNKLDNQTKEKNSSKKLQKKISYKACYLLSEIDQHYITWTWILEL